MKRRARKKHGPGATKHARFWFYWNGGVVRLTLREGETVALGRSEPTDEGYSFEEVELTHEGDRVSRRESRGGRDCDGNHATDYHEAAPLDRLEAVFNEHVGISYPKWEDVRSARVFDEFAQAMNY